MLSNISWMQYAGGLLLVITIYYIYVAIRYYPSELKKLLVARKSELARETFYADPQELSPDVEEAASSEETSEMEEIEQLVVQLTGEIRDCSKQGVTEENLRLRIGTVLSSRSSMRNSPYRSSINELIASECSKYGAFTLDVGDVDEWWNSQM